MLSIDGMHAVDSLFSTAEVVICSERGAAIPDLLLSLIVSGSFMRSRLAGTAHVALASKIRGKPPLSSARRIIFEM